MIIIRLEGGLGNQLFQYSFARSLSYDLNEELYIDLFSFSHNRKSHEIYGLHSYNIKGVVGSYPYFNINENLINFVNYFTSLSIIKNKFGFVKSFSEYLNNHTSPALNFVNEPSFLDVYDFDEKVYSYDYKNKSTYLKGHFQFIHDSKNRLFISDYFFDKHLDLIREDLKYLAKITNESQKIIDEMDKYDSVLIHVRHGDYTKILDMGLCSKEYYEKSIEIITSKIENPKFFIFSDDITWAKNNLKIEYPHEFVDFKDNPNLVGKGTGELLELMSSCKHFIIANSTLSWWAAFLGNYENKIIIAPKPWYQSRRILGVDKIDNIKPISIDNNYKSLFNKSEKTLYYLNEEEFSFEHLKYEKEGQSFIIKDINKSSKIILKNHLKNINGIIIKISLESNSFNCFKVFFKTTENKEYSIKNLFNINLYEAEEFEHYLLFPKNAILDELKIVPGHPYKTEEEYITIKSFEIKELNN